MIVYSSEKKYSIWKTAHPISDDHLFFEI